MPAAAAKTLWVAIKARTRGLRTGLMRAGGLVRGFVSSIKSISFTMASVMKRVVSTILSALRNVLKFAIKWAKRMALAMAAAFVASVVIAARFEHAMQEVFTLLPKMSRKAFDQIKWHIRDMATKGIYSARELAKGLYQVVSAGFTKPAEMKIVLDVSSRAAVAGVTDVFTAVDALTTSLSAYGQTAAQAERNADILFAGVREGKITFGQLSGALGTFISTAAALGVPLQDVTAAIAMMAKAGVNARRGGTALNALLTAMAAPAGAAGTALKKMGVKTVDASGNLLSLVDVIKQFQGMKFAQIRELIPERRAARGLLIMANNFEEFRRMVGAVTKSGGAMQAAYEKMMNTLVNRGKQLWQTFKTIANVIGEAFLLSLRKSIKGMQAWASGVYEALKPGGAWRGSLKKMVVVFERLTTHVRDGVVALGQFLAQLSAEQILTAATKMIDAIAVAVQGTWKAFTVLVNFIPKAYRLMVAFWKDVKEDSDHAANIFKALGEVIATALSEGAKFGWKAFLILAKPAISGLLGTLGAAIPSIKAIAVLMGNTFLQPMKWAAQQAAYFIQKYLVNNLAKVVGWLANQFSRLVGIVAKVYRNIAKVFDPLGINTKWANMFTTLADDLQGFGNAIPKDVARTLQGIEDDIAKTEQRITGKSKQFVETIKREFGAAFDEMSKGAIVNLNEVAENLKSEMPAAFHEMVDQVREKMQHLGTELGKGKHWMTEIQRQAEKGAILDIKVTGLGSLKDALGGIQTAVLGVAAAQADILKAKADLKKATAEAMKAAGLGKMRRRPRKIPTIGPQAIGKPPGRRFRRGYEVGGPGDPRVQARKRREAAKKKVKESPAVKAARQALEQARQNLRAAQQQFQASTQQVLAAAKQALASSQFATAVRTFMGALPGLTGAVAKATMAAGGAGGAGIGGAAGGGVNIGVDVPITVGAGIKELPQKVGQVAEKTLKQSKQIRKLQRDMSVMKRKVANLATGAEGT